MKFKRVRRSVPARGPQRGRRLFLGRRDVPVYGLLIGILAGSLLTIPTVPMLGIPLVVASMALGLLILRERRIAAEELGRAIREALYQEADSFFVDPVTGLANQRRLLEQLPREVARAERYSQPVSLAMIEIPDLRQVRERWGAAGADRAVLHVANTLKRITPHSQLVIRLDEARFAVLFQGKSRAQIGRFCDRVMLAVGNRPLSAGGDMAQPIYVTVRISSVEYERDRFRGPLEFLSAARCDIGVERVRRGQHVRADARDLRRRLVAGYEPGEAGYAGRLAGLFAARARRAV